MREVAIEVKDLCVNYKIMKRQSIKSLLTKKGRDKTSLFSAVKNVSFSLEKGTIMGKGVINNRMTNHVFKILEKEGVHGCLCPQSACLCFF